MLVFDDQGGGRTLRYEGQRTLPFAPVLDNLA
ncbi:hypothetical protein BOTU111921_19515 [Bordetella tumbae]